MLILQRAMPLWFLMLLFTGCISKKLPPRWFSGKNLKHTKTEIIGYAKAEELTIAKQIAMRNIAEMLQVDVTSIFDMETKSSKDSYNRRSSSKINTSSRVRLNDLRVIKVEKLNNMWFVAVAYNNLSLLQKIVNSIQPKRESFTNPYLKQTRLFQALKEQFGFYPKAKIYAQNGQYYIAIDNQQFLISQQEFVELFTNQEHQNIKIKLKDRLHNNELYFIETAFKEFGFASLFLVYENGVVVNMFKNIELVDATFTYPDKKKYDGLRAEVEDGTIQSRDIFVALVCKQKEDIELFNQISTTLEKDSFRFGNLLDLMGKCTFATKIVTIIR